MPTKVLPLNVETWTRRLPEIYTPSLAYKTFHGAAGFFTDLPELIIVVILVHLRMCLRFGTASALLVLWRILYEIIAVLINVLTRPLRHVDSGIMGPRFKEDTQMLDDALLM